MRQGGNRGSVNCIAGGSGMESWANSASGGEMSNREAETTCTVWPRALTCREMVVAALLSGGTCGPVFAGIAGPPTLLFAAADRTVLMFFRAAARFRLSALL